MRNHLLLLAVTGLPLVAPAQQAPVPAYPARRALALTASPQLDHFFTANRALPLGLLYRWPAAAPRATWRVRLSGQYRYDERLTFNNVDPQHTDWDLHLEAALGREWWLPLSPRWQAYAGAEVGVTGGTYRLHETYYSPNSYDPLVPGGLPRINLALEQYYSWTDTGVLLQPLTGIHFKLTKTISLEAEATISLRWSRTRNHGKGFYFDANSGQLKSDPNDSYWDGNFTNSQLSLQLQPISRLHLIYSF